ncbi:helix-turn-helix transcriptional regulator [Thiothrix subterranea]|uniref:Helix-turn-helix transcriptional regulator n=1 Tax=Thiothrix subterranea TaxID=2735563 RepID=A0AA51MMM5_9GAMM|nr:helix-turn-helix transcriptional regulator [Thiothrix subterranea]WML87177.1 helix-turn-helix transcriptional regulator [Thiothrix subterranea]
MARYKDHFLLFILILLAVPYLLNFIHEFTEDYHGIHYLIMEGIITLLALCGASIVVWQMRQRYQENKELHRTLTLTRADLQHAHSDLDALNTKLRDTSKQYSAVIQEQLTAWDLTPSEKAVALLLLKGLSFDEMASVRDTKEKTVRQQASSIYRKSGLNGRHEFAAWFFEDFLG